MVSCGQLCWFLGQLVHQTCPQFERLSLLGRRKGASYSIDSHLCDGQRPTPHPNRESSDAKVCGGICEARIVYEFDCVYVDVSRVLVSSQRR
jgi:hypothetical protein